jgi:hypothetical protein
VKIEGGDERARRASRTDRVARVDGPEKSDAALARTEVAAGDAPLVGAARAELEAILSAGSGEAPASEPGATPEARLARAIGRRLYEEWREED